MSTAAKTRAPRGHWKAQVVSAPIGEPLPVRGIHAVRCLLNAARLIGLRANVRGVDGEPADSRTYLLTIKPSNTL